MMMVRTTIPSRRRIVAAALWSALLVGLGASATTARAQQPAPQAQVEVSMDKKDFATPVFVGLRPNVTQPIYLRVKNLTKVKTPIKVRLLTERDKKLTEVATAELGEIDTQTSKIVTGWKMTADAGAKPEPGTKPEPGIKLDEPPFGLVVVVEAPKFTTPELLRKSLPLKVLQPHSYVHVGDVDYQGGATNKFKITLTADREFKGPPCHVSLVLDKANIPGLDLSGSERVLEGDLTKPGQEIVLSAANFKFGKDGPKEGKVYVTVDDYARAFIYNTDFARASGTPDKVDKRALRVVLPEPAFQPPSDTLPVRLEIDNPPAADMKVRINLYDKDNKEVSKETITLTGDREQSLRLLPPAEDGALLVKPTVHPWTKPFDTKGLSGKFEVRASSEYKEGGEPHSLQGSAKIVFYNEAPKGVAIREPAPAAVVPGKKLTVEATAKSGPVPIAEAVFFLGKMPDDKKVPMGAVKGVLTEEKDGVWVAKATLDLPETMKSPADLTVQFTNVLKLSETNTIEMKWSAPKPTQPYISGTIIENELPQPKLKVELYRVDGTTATSVADTETNDKGEYIFKDVEPKKKYIVYAKKSKSTGQSGVIELAEGQKKEGVVVTLKRP